VLSSGASCPGLVESGWWCGCGDLVIDVQPRERCCPGRKAGDMVHRFETCKFPRFLWEYARGTVACFDAPFSDLRNGEVFIPAERHRESWKLV